MLNQLAGWHEDVDLAFPRLHTNGGSERIHQAGWAESILFCLLLFLFDEILGVFEFGFLLVYFFLGVNFRVRHPLGNPFIGR